MPKNSFLHVAVGVIENTDNEILISKRHLNQDQGGLWEFPGGKVKTNEPTENALKRELKEELNIEVIKARPFIKLKHDYNDYSVLLDVWKVLDFKGKAFGREGQKFEWLKKTDLSSRDFPKANDPIISALSLPSLYFITPEPGSMDEDIFMEGVERILFSGCKLIQLRSKEKTISDLKPIIDSTKRLCKKHAARLLINSQLDINNQTNLDGIHLNSRDLMQLNKRPLGKDCLVAASCHNQLELEYARAIDVDFAVLGPVMKSNSHEDIDGMGWDNFSAFLKNDGLPVYALGGMALENMRLAWQHGAQGLAMISDLWRRVDRNESFSIRE